MIILTKTWLSHVLGEVSCITLFLSLSALAELALAGAVIAKAPVAPPRVKVIKGIKVDLVVLQLY